jgi:hypothetical protein
MKEQNREIPKYTEDCVSEKDCQRTRASCCVLIEQKIKNAIISLKLWLVVSVLIFLTASGGSFVCAVRSAGRIEERIDNVVKKQDAIETQVEQLRKEIWEISKDETVTTSATRETRTDIHVSGL